MQLNTITSTLLAVGLVAGSLGISSDPEQADEHSEKPVTWKEIDHAGLFLLDLTGGPATYVVAFVAGENGEITHEEAALHRLKFAPMSSKIIAARTIDPVPLETDYDETILVNVSEKRIIAYFQTATELHEIPLLKGEGVAIGKLPKYGTRRFKSGCKCFCDDGEGIRREAMMYCEEVLDGRRVDGPCNCKALEGTLCYAYDDEGELVEGTIQDCRDGLVATEPGGRRSG